MQKRSQAEANGGKFVRSRKEKGNSGFIAARDWLPDVVTSGRYNLEQLMCGKKEIPYETTDLALPADRPVELESGACAGCAA
jgi:hypothetical protein